MKKLYKEESAIEQLENFTNCCQYGEYVVVDWDMDEEILGKRIGECITELIRKLKNEGIEPVAGTEQIIVKTMTKTLAEWRIGMKTKTKATVALKVLAKRK